MRAVCAGGSFATTRLPVPANPFALAAVQMPVGGAIVLSISLGRGDRVDVGAVSATTWWAWAYVAVVVSFGASVPTPTPCRRCRCRPSRTYAYVNPVAVLLGVAVVGERFTPVQLLGGAIAAAAVVLVLAAERPSRERQGSLAPSGL